MADQELLVRIVGDDRDLQRSLTRSTRAVKEFDRRVTTVSGRTTGAGQATRGALSTTGGAGGFLFGSPQFVASALTTAAIAKTVKAASDLNEEVSKSKQVFGDSSLEILDWSKTTASAIGISRQEALQATGTFGNLFNTVGLGQKPAADMSKALVQLTADLASFNNASPEDVLLAIRSGLIGEAEPLRRYGVLLSESRVQQEAMTETGKTNARSLTDQEKALARYNIILKDTAPAQGDFARTQEGLANQARILRAELKDLASTLGTVLLPVVLEVTQAINDTFDIVRAINSLGGVHLDLEGLTVEQVEALRAKFADLEGETSLWVEALDGAIARLKLLQSLGPNDQGGLLGIGAITASNERVDARNELNAARRTKNELETSRKRFAEFIKGLELKLEKAGLTPDSGDDLSVLREIERRIQKQIEREGRTYKLAFQLVRVRKQIQDTIEQQQAGQEEQATASAQRAADKAESEREKRRRINERQRAARQAEQFEALGLTAGGDKRTPGSGALLRRAQSLQDQLKGSSLDTPKTREQLQRIVSVLRKNFKTAGKEVRQAILQMLNDISSALEGKGPGTKKGPLTSTHGLETAQIIKNLGLTVEQAEEIQRRLAHATTSGAISRSVGTRGTATLPRRGFGEMPVVVESRTNLYLDGTQIASVVTREQQKAKRRNPRQKRGPNRR